jgi:HEAT repeat protein
LIASAAPTTLPTQYGGQGFDYPAGIFANHTAPRTVQLIGEALQRAKTTADQAHDLHELGATRRKEAGAFISPFLSNAEPALRAVAAEAAGAVGDASLRGRVEELLKDPSPLVRRAALKAGVRLAADAGAKADLVHKMLGDGQPAVALEAMALAQPANAGQIASLLAKEHPELQAEGIQTLGRLKAGDQAAVVVPFLKNEDVALQGAAIAALGQMRATDQTQAVLAFLGNAHPTLRRAAAMAMGQLAQPPVQQKRAMELLQKDPDPSVRQAACGIFAAHPLADAVDLLVKQLYDPYLPLHDAARDALSHSASDAMTRQIIASAVTLLHESDQRRKEDGSFLLGHYRSEAALEDHIALIHGYPQGGHPPVDWNLYTQAVRSLGRIGNPQAGPPLVPLLKKAPITMAALMNSTVSLDAEEAALVAVGQMKFTGALPQVWRIVNGSGQEEPENMRAAALWAVGTLTAPDDKRTNEALIKVIVNAQDNPAVARYEACKALANRHVAAAADALKQLSSTDTDPQARYAAHQAYQQISGQTLPYTPPDLPWTAETSISDITGQ